MHAFIQGYVTWHFCDARSRMCEVYERVGDSPHELKFRHYYEAAMKAGSIDIQDWTAPTAMANGFKQSSHPADLVKDGS